VTVAQCLRVVAQQADKWAAARIMQRAFIDSRTAAAAAAAAEEAAKPALLLIVAHSRQRSLVTGSDIIVACVYSAD